MKKRLQLIYWQGICITLVMAALAIIMAAKVEIDETRSHLSALLHAASRWTLDSNEDLQSLATSIAEVSPSLRVTFLLNSGLVLADSTEDESSGANHSEDAEIRAARAGKTGRHIRMSAANASLTLYLAEQISPQLILRLSYPVFPIVKILLSYSTALLVLFLVLFWLQRSSISRFIDDQGRQLEDVRRLLDGQITSVDAVFPEYQPSLDAISYRVRRLQEDQQEIRQTLDLRRNFVANASHELRSPLTSIRGYAEMIDEGMASTPEEQQLCIHTILNECDRMLEVIKDILLLSKAENRHTPAEEITDAAPVTREVVRALQPQAASRNIRLELNTPEAVSVRARQKDIWEICFNLIDNAIRYGKENGTVSVTLQEHSLLVEDDGIGMSPDELEHIFEPFYRVDDARQAESSGTGLGLSIVWAIVEGLGGTIHAESVPGKGSRFLVKFPEV